MELTGKRLSTTLPTLAYGQTNALRDSGSSASLSGLRGSPSVLTGNFLESATQAT
jgi:hypothetical protein